MRPWAVLLALPLLLAPSFALAHEDDMPGMPGMSGHMPAHAAHTHQRVSAHGLTATFHIFAPRHPLYTCPMHPEITSSKPGKDTGHKDCGMTLVKQTHAVGIMVEDAKHRPLTNAKVRLTLVDANGMSQHLDLKGTNYYEGAFHLMPGKYQITADVTPAGAKQAISFKTPYQVK